MRGGGAILPAHHRPFTVACDKERLAAGVPVGLQWCGQFGKNFNHHCFLGPARRVCIVAKPERCEPSPTLAKVRCPDFGIRREQFGQPHWQRSLHSLIALRSADYENWNVVLETIHARAKRQIQRSRADLCNQVSMCGKQMTSKSSNMCRDPSIRVGEHYRSTIENIGDDTYEHDQIIFAILISKDIYGCGPSSSARGGGSVMPVLAFGPCS